MTKEENDQKNRQPDKVREESVIDFAEIYREIEKRNRSRRKSV